MPTRRRRPFLLLLVIILLVCAGAALMPWAFHIGNRCTPLTWWGSGTLVTKGGTYPLFLMLFPSSHFSRLRMDGRRPTGGLQGSACLCTSPGMYQYLKLSGTIYDAWSTTDGSLVEFRLLEPTRVITRQPQRGYFDLYGTFQGENLVMNQRGSWSSPFRSGLRINNATAALRWHPFWSCKSACETPGAAIR